MQMPQIRLHSQSALIGIEARPAVQSIEQPRADLQLEQPMAKIEMRTVPGRLTIDQTEAWEQMDIKHIFTRITENAAKGRQAVLEGMERIGYEGDELMNIQTGRDAIVDQAERSMEGEIHDANITWVPAPFSVKLAYQPGRLTMDAQPQKVINNTQIRKPVISYQPGEAAVSIRRHNELKVDFVNLKFKGVHYEQEI